MIMLNNAMLINDGISLFEQVSFSLSGGEALLLSGPSGIGKTSLLRALLGLSIPFLFQGSMQVKNSIGYAPQSLDLWPHLTTIETLQLLKPAKVSFHEFNQRIDELFCGLELNKQKNVLAKKLSGGEKQRLNLARSMLLKPSLLIWDEPFSAQDGATKKRILLFIRDYLKLSNIAILLVSHDDTDAQLLDYREVKLISS